MAVLVFFLPFSKEASFKHDKGNQLLLNNCSIGRSLVFDLLFSAFVGSSEPTILAPLLCVSRFPLHVLCPQLQFCILPKMPFIRTISRWFCSNSGNDTGGAALVNAANASTTAQKPDSQGPTSTADTATAVALNGNQPPEPQWPRGSCCNGDTGRDDENEDLAIVEVKTHHGMMSTLDSKSKDGRAGRDMASSSTSAPFQNNASYNRHSYGGTNADDLESDTTEATRNDLPFVSATSSRSTSKRKQNPLPSWDSLGPRDRMKMQQTLDELVVKFLAEMKKGKVLMKVGRNGKMFYRWCYVMREDDRFFFVMNVKGQLVEYPFEHILHVRFGFDFSDFFQLPVAIPSENLSAVMILRDNRRLNLVFQNVEEQEEFVTCMLMLIAKVKATLTSTSGQGRGFIAA
ncbi:unnamed protein product [Amoebophrya sp. A120]|nr:unnamed protein product [Amoebophrya sp. A120]|eukprot:GSA120T00004007001.1